MYGTFQIERFEMKLQFIRFNFGIIEHIIDDDQQRLARISDCIHIQLLFFGNARIGQNFRHAHYAIHRSANFVAHVGKKRRLCPVG